MAESKIEWTDYTFNPWIGCSKVSSGCANCYAERDFDQRRGRAKWGPHGTRSRTSDANWKLPLQWNRQAGTCPECGAKPPRVQVVAGRCVCTACGIEGQQVIRPRVFCASLADVFEDWDGLIVDHNGKRLYSYIDHGTAIDGSIGLTMADLRRDLFELIDATPHLDWLIVTKRPENIRRMWPAFFPGGYLPEAGEMNQEGPRRNVWLLSSVEDQQTADARVPELLKCRDLATVLGLSCEPLLGPVNLHPWLCRSGSVERPEQKWCDSICEPSRLLDWVIAGGESGPHARPMHPDWARGLRDQCAAGGVPFFFKQWGEWLPSTLRPDGKLETRTAAGTPNGPRRPDLHNWPDLDAPSLKVGKQAAGRLLDGSEHSEYPNPAS